MVFIVLITVFLFLAVSGWWIRYLVKKRTAGMLVLFSRCGTKLGLSFTAQEVLKDGVLGLDGMQRKLLFLKRQGHRYDMKLMDLDEITGIEIRQDNSINTVEPGGDLDPYHVDVVHLHFNLADGSAADVPFYVHLRDDRTELWALLQKAKDWQAVLTKMLRSSSEWRA